MTLCPGCNHGLLEPLTSELRTNLAINDATIRSVCSADCGTVARHYAAPLRIAVNDPRPPVLKTQ